jgi:uncharacterized protein YdeI (YjbR/CyaY-like superfamily)
MHDRKARSQSRPALACPLPVVHWTTRPLATSATPRNKKYITALEKAGLMHAAGRAKINEAKQDGSWTLLDDVEAPVSSPDLEAALSSTPGARANYEGFTPGAKRGLLWWIKSARTKPTRGRRVSIVAQQAAKGRVANA